MTKKSIRLLSIFTLLFSLIGCSLHHTHKFVEGICSCGEKEEIEFFTVKFKDYDGTIIKEEEVEKGKDAVCLDEPKRFGYKFIGWDKDITNVKEDMEVMALYEENIQTAKEWLNNIKFGINYFNGINEENDNDAYFKWIKEEGFNAVEIGCRFPELVDDIYGKLNIEKVTKLREIIDAAYKYDLFIILTFYDGYDYMWTSLNPSNQESIIKMLNTSYKEIVSNLNTYDDKLAISFCSEPRDYTDNLVDKDDLEVLNIINKEFVRMVRSTGGNNLKRKLVITTGWSRCYGSSAENFKMVDDEFVIVRIHLYQPGNFANSKTSDSEWLEEEYQLKLLGYFQQMKKNFLDVGIPIYIGEFGTRPKDNDQERNKWAKCYLSLANSYNIKCFIWDTENKGSGIANSFAISNKKELIWLNPEYMNYILNLVDNNYIPFYNTYNQTISIDEEIIIPNKITNLITHQEEDVNIQYDENLLIIKNGKYYAKNTGKIVFSYSLNGYNYYYQYEITKSVKTTDFDLEIRTNENGLVQCYIITNGFSITRLDYNWSSTNEQVITISKYSTITIVGDGECSIIAKNIETGSIGILDIVVTNGMISSVISRHSNIQ